MSTESPEITNVAVGGGKDALLFGVRRPPGISEPEGWQFGIVRRDDSLLHQGEILTGDDDPYSVLHVLLSFAHAAVVGAKERGTAAGDGQFPTEAVEAFLKIAEDLALATLSTDGDVPQIIKVTNIVTVD